MTLTTTIVPIPAEDVAAIRATDERFAELIIRRDFDALVELYTENAVFMPPHQPAVRGRAALRAWMSAFPNVSRFAFDVDEIDGRADLAYVRGRYSMTLQPDGAPEPISDVGKFIEIRRKQADGSWLLAADIFNSDQA